jgi:hypothetical protein
MILPILIAMAGYAIYKSSRGEDQPIGRDAQGTEIYFSESSERSKPNYYKGIYTGQKHECVELVRRWLIRNKGVTFNEVENAIDLLDLTHARSVAKYNVLYPMIKISKDPGVADLIVFKPSASNSFYGHVAIVTRVLQDRVQLAEQNYVERMTADYTREIPLVDGVLQDKEIAGVMRVIK